MKDHLGELAKMERKGGKRDSVKDANNLLVYLR